MKRLNTEDISRERFQSGVWEDIMPRKGFPGGSDGKESTCNSGDLGSIPGSGRFPGEGDGNPLQYSLLENPMDRGAWQVAVHGVAKIRMTPWRYSF